VNCFGYSVRREVLPNTGGVYLVYSWLTCVYVGRTSNFARRLYNHTNHYSFLKLKVTHIELIECEVKFSNSTNHFGDLERELIALHKPLLNYIPVKVRA
jgi:excinuclease UvrABC nuclease subunit